jgi:hypothetical protein
VPDRPLPTPADPIVAHEAFERDAPKALEGFVWRQQTPLSILVEIPAICPDGTTDTYLARLAFLHYPELPPSVTFVDPTSEKYAPAAWPKVEGLPNISFSAAYGDAPEGMVCNSMFFEYYFWGGHSPDAKIRWDSSRMTFAATLTELRDALRQPYYKGPNR